MLTISLGSLRRRLAAQCHLFRSGTRSVVLAGEVFDGVVLAGHPYNPVWCPLVTMIIIAIYHTGFTKKTMWNGLEYVFYCYNNFEFLVWLNYINQLVLLNNQLGCSAVISLLYRSSCLLSTQLLDFYQNRHEHVR